MTPSELQQNLRQFTGTEAYHHWSILFRNFVMTDGAKFLAEEAGAYWLMDAIASHIKAYNTERFVLAKLHKKSRGWLLRIEDGNDTVLASQKIDFSDFPLDEIDLYVIPQQMEHGDVWVILLPQEY